MTISTIPVIARAALESAGVFKYLFDASAIYPFEASAIHPDDKRFLLNYVEMCGLIIRAGYDAQDPEHIARLETEKKRINELKTIMPTYKLYSELTTKQQQNVIDGRWKPFNKSDLPVILCFGPKTIATAYEYLSDYVHNGYLAALQITQPEGSKRMAEASLIPISIALAFTTEILYENFEAVRTLIDGDPDLKQAVVVWVDAGKM